MRPAMKLWQQACRITLFTNPQCSLCDSAKSVLAEARKRRAFDLREINVHDKEHKQWYNAYCFDTPVIHVENAESNDRGDVVHASQKLMHRFRVEDVEAKIDQLASN